MMRWIGAILAIWLAASAAAATEMDTHPHPTLTGRHIAGYQGWFGCPGDGRDGGGWVHWFHRRPDDGQLLPTVDLLPDTAEFMADEGCPTNWTDAEGRMVRLYTAQDARTIERHFAWMERYGLDGVALQRFLGEIRNPARRAARDRVLQHVRRAAEAHGRSFFVMYDLSGGRDDQLHLVVEDWQALLASGIADSPAYQRHRGRPVLGIWGIGFRDRPLTPAGMAAFLTALRQASPGGVTLLGGVPAGWRTLDGDAAGDPGWRQVYRDIEVLSPWTVGRFADMVGADAYRSQRMEPDLRETALAGQDYMPVIFPGFSWSNLMRARGREAASNQIPRRCGAFYWHQAANAIGAGARMLYTAMFDEVDEGTAIFKLTPTSRNLPTTGGFVPLDADGCRLASDWYLRLAGEITRALAAGRLPAAMPAGPQ